MSAANPNLEAARDRLVAAALRYLVADEAEVVAVKAAFGAKVGDQAYERCSAASREFDAALAGLLAAARSWRNQAALARLEEAAGEGPRPGMGQGDVI